MAETANICWGAEGQAGRGKNSGWRECAFHLFSHKRHKKRKTYPKGESPE
jgi:hypothetical protein